MTTTQPNILDSQKKIVEQFKNPGSEFRGIPFWGWNAKLDPKELRRQIRKE